MTKGEVDNMDYNKFITNWLERAEREENSLDDADRFINLWIAFNAWMKKEYGESKLDAVLISEAKNNRGLESIFDKLKDNQLDKNLKKIKKKGLIYDMRYPGDTKKAKEYNASFGSLLDVIYQVRCNLFHGRKNIKDDTRDEELVEICYQILLPLFKNFFKK
jgi:hypothetical protein